MWTRTRNKAIDTLAGQLYLHEQGLPRRPGLSMIEGAWVDGKTPPAARTRRRAG